MTQLDNKFVPLAQRLLEKYGIEATFQEDVSTFDPTTNKRTGQVVEHTIRVTPPNTEHRFINGQQRTVTVIYAAGGDFSELNPKVLQEVVVHGSTRTIMGVESYSSGEQVALYGFVLDG